MQSVAAQYGVLPAAQRELPWPEWSVLVAGLMDDTPLGRLAAARLQRDPAALRRMTPWQKRERARWRRFLAGRRQRRADETRREQRTMQTALARMFGQREGGKMQ